MQVIRGVRRAWRHPDVCTETIANRGGMYFRTGRMDKCVLCKLGLVEAFYTVNITFRPQNISMAEGIGIRIGGGGDPQIYSK